MRILTYLASFLFLFTACDKDETKPNSTPTVDPNKPVLTLQVTSPTTAKDLHVFVYPKDKPEERFTYDVSYSETPKVETARQIGHGVDATFMIGAETEFKPVEGNVHAELLADGKVIASLDFDTLNPPKDPATSTYYIKKTVTIP
ncbi:hypothetical protein [Hymenobacter sp. BT730]|uniref:hypothetical protein n=1 Tax=Hymenobacter sp. BT730 TaxID=3063332 RepID=UPI0026DF9402|nr:hypothetical protein [Hymenobacter sp. BT730]